MGKRMFFRNLLAAGFVSAAFVCTGANLLENPGFERCDAGEGAVSWTPPGGAFAYQSGSGRNGTRALFFDLKPGSPYRFPSQKFKSEPGKRYRAEVWTRTENLQGDELGARVGLEFYAENHTYLRGVYSTGVKGTVGDWTRLDVVGDAPAGTVDANISVFVNDKFTGRAWFDDACVEPAYRPPIGPVVSDVYRETAADGDVSFSAVVDLPPAEVAARGVTGWFDLPSVSGPPRTVPAAVEDGAIRVKTAVKELPEGECRVTARLSDRSGKNIAQKTIRFRRTAEAPKWRVRFDGKNRTLVDGKPFFPLGVYVSRADAATIADLKGTPLNCVLPYVPITRKELDACWEAGLRAIGAVQCHFGVSGCPADVKRIEDETRWIVERVNPLKDHPGLLGWYVYDELGTELYDRLAARRDLLEKLDPDHPTYAALYQMDILRDYLGTFDVLGTDPYPVAKRGNPPISMAADWTRRSRLAVFGGKPLWQIPQIFDWGGYDKERVKETRAPTYEEMRNMTHQCLAEGANGIIFWAHLAVKKMSWRDPFETRWPEIMRMAAEVKENIPLFLSDDPAPHVKASPSCVSARAWRLGNDVHVLAVNTTREPVSAEVETEGIGKQKIELPPIGVSWTKKTVR
ncbi:MAG TPA: hypothetical protein PKI32_01390 [Opitutales bacterium]|nr:hypothetical protein [Opitutales bacterium]